MFALPCAAGILPVPARCDASGVLRFGQPHHWPPRAFWKYRPQRDEGREARGDRRRIERGGAQQPGHQQHHASHRRDPAQIPAASAARRLQEHIAAVFKEKTHKGTLHNITSKFLHLHLHRTPSQKSAHATRPDAAAAPPVEVEHARQRPLPPTPPARHSSIMASQRVQKARVRACTRLWRLSSPQAKGREAIRRPPVPPLALEENSGLAPLEPSGLSRGNVNRHGPKLPRPPARVSFAPDGTAPPVFALAPRFRPRQSRSLARMHG